MFEKKYTLLRSQRARVHEILREIPLEPGEFSWSTETIAGAHVVSRLNHRDGQYYFQFSSYELNAWCVACPGMYRTMDYQHPKNWEEQEGFLRTWAQCLKRELDTPDPWADLARHQLALDGELSGEMVNEPIPAVEAEQIGQALARLADTVTGELTLVDGQSLLVRTKLMYLAEAAKRERSRDWTYMTLGAWASLVTALSLSEERAARLGAMVRNELGPFISLLRPKAQTPPQRDKRILGIWPVGGHSSDSQHATGEQARQAASEH
jgi:hypothetical protein